MGKTMPETARAVSAVTWQHELVRHYVREHGWTKAKVLDYFWGVAPRTTLELWYRRAKMP